MEIICISLENNQYFLVTQVGPLPVRVPITAEVAQLLLALGVPQCS
ncbi:exosporium protein G [Priestia taiwanensis]|uniref:Uncharacterized protein n=1 Tax=Priestia taiwanensis TaxID=1347902 RepID=A0A917AJN5_9BACI|nr:exosporium protein G [Priestia taiwanensis]MBM7361919.1 hypothetical protein [Priestia taiwanensis]GGE57992.1 hypothetical protein GCM10007140_05460 [Priestia taiwanensis]